MTCMPRGWRQRPRQRQRWQTQERAACPARPTSLVRAVCATKTHERLELVGEYNSPNIPLSFCCHAGDGGGRHGSTPYRQEGRQAPGNARASTACLNPNPTHICFVARLAAAAESAAEAADAEARRAADEAEKLRAAFRAFRAVKARELAGVEARLRALLGAAPAAAPNLAGGAQQAAAPLRSRVTAARVPRAPAAGGAVGKPWPLPCTPNYYLCTLVGLLSRPSASTCCRLPFLSVQMHVHKLLRLSYV